MEHLFSVTEAKAKFSEIINRIIYRKERIIVTKKGKKVAMVIPLEEKRDSESTGLIRARGVLSGLDDEIDRITDDIYEQRNKETDREVKI